jgi:xanthine dehydrogenase accessory factor
MRDILSDILPWWLAGDTFALATVVNTFGSAPRQPGAAMAVSSSGEVVGSVSGGCVEGAVYELARQVLESGQPVLQSYGISTDDAFAAGLTCGGTLEVFVEAVDRQTFPELAEIASTAASDQPVAVATTVAGSNDSYQNATRAPGARRVIWPDRAAGSLGSDGLDGAADAEARDLLAHGGTGERTFGRNGEPRQAEVTVFVQSLVPSPQMLVFGAIDFAAAVARMGKFLGYRVVICDARGLFATQKRFPYADEVVVDWPHRYLDQAHIDQQTAICVLTHDPKFDIPLLAVALRSAAGFVGALGSRRTHEERVRLLRESGVTETELRRLHAPIGLDLGALTPEETAVSIAAELIQTRRGGSGRPLRGTDGPIHHTPAPPA